MHRPYVLRNNISSSATTSAQDAPFQQGPTNWQPACRKMQGSVVPTPCELQLPVIASARRSSCPINRAPGFLPIFANAHIMFEMSLELNSPDIASSRRSSCPIIHFLGFVPLSQMPKNACNVLQLNSPETASARSSTLPIFFSSSQMQLWKVECWQFLWGWPTAQAVPLSRIMMLLQNCIFLVYDGSESFCRMFLAFAVLFCWLWLRRMDSQHKREIINCTVLLTIQKRKHSTIRRLN